MRTNDDVLRPESRMLERSYQVQLPRARACSGRHPLRDRKPVLVREIARNLHAVTADEKVVRRRRYATAHLCADIKHFAVVLPTSQDIHGEKFRRVAFLTP